MPSTATLDCSFISISLFAALSKQSLQHLLPSLVDDTIRGQHCSVLARQGTSGLSLQLSNTPSVICPHLGWDSVLSQLSQNFLHKKFFSLSYHITNSTLAIVLRQVIWKLRVLNSNPADIVVSFWCVHFDVMTFVAHLNADETQRAHLWHLATLTSTIETESIEKYWQIYIKIQF